MSNEEVTMFAIRGFIADLPDDKRAEVEACIVAIRSTLEQYPPEWQNLAIALIGAEMQLKNVADR